MRGKEGFSLGESPLGRSRVAYTLQLYNYLLRISYNTRYIYKRSK